MKPLFVASMLAAAVFSNAAAQAAEGADAIGVRDGVRYACTGVGSESREDPRWREFPAKLVFAGGDGGYLSRVTTRIADGQGRTVFEIQDCGPWLLLDLPPGRYKAAVTAQDGHGRSHDSEASIAVGSAGQAETVVRFPEIVD